MVDQEGQCIGTGQEGMDGWVEEGQTRRKAWSVLHQCSSIHSGQTYNQSGSNTRHKQQTWKLLTATERRKEEASKEYGGRDRTQV